MSETSMEATASGDAPAANHNPPGSPGNSDVLAAVNRLGEQFETKLAIDAVKDRQIKQLHTELLEHRQGLMQSMVQPLVMQIIRLRDDITRRAESIRGKSPEQADSDRVLRELKGFGEDLLILLEGAGVVPFEEPQTAFNPARQQSVVTVICHEPQRHGQISQRVNPGYEMNGRVLIKERVRVFVFDKSAAPPDPVVKEAAPQVSVNADADPAPAQSVISITP